MNCGRCGYELGSPTKAGYCDKCGNPFSVQAVVPQSSHTDWKSDLASFAHTLTLAAGVTAYKRAGFVAALLAVASVAITIELISLVVRGSGILFRRVVRPAAQKAKEEGLVGVSKAVYEKAVKPVLYGKSASQGK